MPFQAILKDLAERSSAAGAVLLDWEGEIVASYSNDPRLELDLIGAHHGIILDIIRDAAAHDEGGAGVKTVAISTDSSRLVILSVKDGYYLVVALERSRSAGRAVYESKKAITRIEKEMG